MRSSTRPIAIAGPGRIGLGALLRASALLLVGAALVFAAVPASAETDAEPTLRGDVVVSGDVVHFGDLVTNAPAEVAAVPVFRAPSLGELGTIQVDRILITAHALGLADIETGGRATVTVTRAARRIDQDAVAAALAEVVAAAASLPVGEIEIVFEGTPPMLLTLPQTVEPVAITDLAFDPASRRFAATAYVGPSAAERRAQASISGVVRRVVEVAVLTRAIGRGEPIHPGDYRIERRNADLVSAETRLDALALEERVARRALSSGTPLRQADLERPMLVSRNDMVLMVYERGALTLTLRGRAEQAGARGDVVNIRNTASDRVLQAEVIGPGTVRVGPSFIGRVAALDSN